MIHRIQEGVCRSYENSSFYIGHHRLYYQQDSGYQFYMDTKGKVCLKPGMRIHKVPFTLRRDLSGHLPPPSKSLRVRGCLIPVVTIREGKKAAYLWTQSDSLQLIISPGAREVKARL